MRRPRPPVSCSSPARLLCLSLLLAPALAGCSDADEVRVIQPPGDRASEEAAEPSPDTSGEPGAVGVDAPGLEEGQPSGPLPALDCSSAGRACEPDDGQRCVLSCETTSDGCVIFSEFVPLGGVPSGYYVQFDALGPAGEYVYFEHVWAGGSWEQHPFSWTPEHGLEPLDDQVGAVADPEDNVVRSAAIRQVGADGSLLGPLIEDDAAQTGFYWTRSGGLTRLDFDPARMSQDGSIIVGVRNGRAVIWQRSTGVRRLDGGDIDEPSSGDTRRLQLSNSGELATFSVTPAGSAQSTSYVWSSTRGITEAGQFVGLAGASVHMAASGEVLFASQSPSDGDPRRLFRWTAATGARDLGALAGVPVDEGYSPTFISSDGAVLVGTAGSSTFRWSEASGMHIIAGSSTGISTPLYVSPAGDTVVGALYEPQKNASFRWNERDGYTALEGDVRNGVALQGDLLLERTSDGSYGVRRFGRALNGASPESELLLRRYVPEGWAGLYVEGMSENGRLLAGTASNSTSYQAWLSRASRTCPEPVSAPR